MAIKTALWLFDAHLPFLLSASSKIEYGFFFFAFLVPGMGPDSNRHSPGIY